MTESETMKYLERFGKANDCSDLKFDIPKCFYSFSKLASAAICLINSKNEEIERLTALKDALLETYGECMTESVKGLVSLLKKGAVNIDDIDDAIIEEMLFGGCIDVREGRTDV